jgi:hypothetical protein
MQPVGKPGFGLPGAYADSLKLQNPRARLAEVQPVLRRYNFVLENCQAPDDSGAGGSEGRKEGGRKGESERASETVCA